MSYVDGFVVPVPEQNLKQYRTIAQKAGKIWKEHGALFSFIVFKSRTDRDKVNAKVMKDPRMNKMMEAGGEMPFDVKRMLYGGFKSLIDM
jgi:uncharacterized protein YbaA (DUF1428 family)